MVTFIECVRALVDSLNAVAERGKALFHRSRVKRGDFSTGNEIALSVARHLIGCTGGGFNVFLQFHDGKSVFRFGHADVERFSQIVIGPGGRSLTFLEEARQLEQVASP